jgi:DNA invertase Pin-like site-specific DNA recombinase
MEWNMATKKTLDIDAAMAKRIKAAKKASPQARNFKGNAQVNTAEPAFSIVMKLGGVREVARYLECSPGTVTRWCTPKTKAKPNGGGGVVPEDKQEALRAMAADKLVKIAKNAFNL